MSATRGGECADLVNARESPEHRHSLQQRAMGIPKDHAVDVDGDLANARTVWLYTDGAGTYASSTVALMHRRREHGLLVTSQAPLDSPHVFVSHIDVTVIASGESINLATHQFPFVQPTCGYKHLAHFEQDPLPRWVFRGPGWELERTLALVRGANTVVLRHEWRGSHRVILEARPLLAMRRASDLMRENGGAHHRVCLHANEVVVQPVKALPRVVFRHRGSFVGSPDWWRCFEYLSEHGPDVVREDLWTPGVFRIELQPGESTCLVCGVGSVPEDAPEKLIADAVDCRNEPGAKLIESPRQAPSVVGRDNGAGCSRSARKARTSLTGT